MRNILLWALALVIMLAAAAYQRRTGPTYPVSGTAEIAGQSFDYSLERSHGGPGDQPVRIPLTGSGIQGSVEWRRFKVDEPWTEITMVPEAGEESQVLAAYLPHQPPAGKLEYRVILTAGDERLVLPERRAAVTRFRGDVPALFLAPHILFMFIGLLLSTRTGLAALSSEGKTRRLAIWSFGLLVVGGMILGPIVQYYAFGALWTGVPFGWDLTDNKTLIFVVAWAWALYAGRGGRNARTAVLTASVLTLAVYLIPHSVLGSELDYSAQ